MRTSLWFVGAAVASAVVGVSVFRSDPMNRATIDALRVDPAALDASLKEIFAKTHISFGVEVVDSVAAQPRISPAVRTAAILDLSGLSARQAFSRLLVAAPAYDSSRADRRRCLARSPTRDIRGHQRAVARCASCRPSPL